MAGNLGLEFFVVPPNTQGLTFLQQLGMVGPAGVVGMANGSPEYLHALIEIKKLAFADRDRWIGDPDFVHVPVDRLLEPSYLEARARLVSPDLARESTGPGFGDTPRAQGTPSHPTGDTVFLTAVDAFGNAVSWIQSIFFDFGSALFEPESGILFHNRGIGFSLEDGHPNQVAPGKRPFHTLSPALALERGSLAFTLGTPGADGQTQTLTQVVLNHCAFGMSPQEAIEAPRFRSYAGLDVGVESRFSKEALDGLSALGHEVRPLGAWAIDMGGAQMIRRNPQDGTLIAAADPRREAKAEVL
jgi:gamma-glutamyltranspeptidase/glutathione hydrolase